MHNGYAWLRENLLPYSYGLAVYEHEIGMPMMRPLSMELPGKPEVDGMDWQGRDAFSEGAYLTGAK